MFIKIVILVALINVVFGQKLKCNHDVALKLAKRHSYDFSIEILEHVRIESKGNFVFSPIQTWLQLMNLMEGATGETWRELQRTTGHHKNVCFRRKLRESINELMHEEHNNFKINSVIVIDKLMNVKDRFKAEVEKSQSTNALRLDFHQPEISADLVNKLIADETGGAIEEIIAPEDFELNYLLMFDVVYFKSSWRTLFDTKKTKKEVFYADDGYPVGHSNMMTQTGIFNYTSLPKFNLDVLELPCDDQNRVSMLVFLTKGKRKANHIFEYLNNTRLGSIFYKFAQGKPKTVEVSIPRFEINTEIHLPDLVYDMGVKSVFYLDKARLRGISDFKLNTSDMVQKAKIEISEGGIEASSVSENIGIRDDIIQFKANRPFSYIIVDKNTEFILFAGMYSIPE